MHRQTLQSSLIECDLMFHWSIVTWPNGTGRPKVHAKPTNELTHGCACGWVSQLHFQDLSSSVHVLRRPRKQLRWKRKMFHVPTSQVTNEMHTHKECTPLKQLPHTMSSWPTREVPMQKSWPCHLKGRRMLRCKIPRRCIPFPTGLAVYMSLLGFPSRCFCDPFLAKVELIKRIPAFHSIIFRNHINCKSFWEFHGVWLVQGCMPRQV